MNDPIDILRSRQDGVTVPRIGVMIVVSVLIHLLALLGLPSMKVHLPSDSDLPENPGALTLRLAATVTAILLLVGTPIAWWLARSKAWWKGPVSAVVAMPLVLLVASLSGLILGLLGDGVPDLAASALLSVPLLALAVAWHRRG